MANSTFINSALSGNRILGGRYEDDDNAAAGGDKQNKTTTPAFSAAALAPPPAALVSEAQTAPVIKDPPPAPAASIPKEAAADIPAAAASPQNIPFADGVEASLSAVGALVDQKRREDGKKQKAAVPADDDDIPPMMDFSAPTNIAALVEQGVSFQEIVQFQEPMLDSIYNTIRGQETPQNAPQLFMAEGGGIGIQGTDYPPLMIMFQSRASGDIHYAPDIEGLDDGMYHARDVLTNRPLGDVLKRGDDVRIFNAGPGFSGIGESIQAGLMTGGTNILAAASDTASRLADMFNADGAADMLRQFADGMSEDGEVYALDRSVFRATPPLIDEDGSVNLSVEAFYNIGAEAIPSLGGAVIVGGSSGQLRKLAGKYQGLSPVELARAQLKYQVGGAVAANAVFSSGQTALEARQRLEKRDDLTDEQKKQRENAAAIVGGLFGIWTGSLVFGGKGGMIPGQQVSGGLGLNIARDTLYTAGRESVQEAIEEAGQTIIAARFAGDNLTGRELAESALAGAIGGSVAGGVVGASHNFGRLLWDNHSPKAKAKAEAVADEVAGGDGLYRRGIARLKQWQEQRGTGYLGLGLGKAGEITRALMSKNVGDFGQVRNEYLAETFGHIADEKRRKARTEWSAFLIDEARAAANAGGSGASAIADYFLKKYADGSNLPPNAPGRYPREGHQEYLVRLAGLAKEELRKVNSYVATMPQKVIDEILTDIVDNGVVKLPAGSENIVGNPLVDDAIADVVVPPVNVSRETSQAAAQKPKRAAPAKPKTAKPAAAKSPAADDNAVDTAAELKAAEKELDDIRYKLQGAELDGIDENSDKMQKWRKEEKAAYDKYRKAKAANNKRQRAAAPKKREVVHNDEFDALWEDVQVKRDAHSATNADLVHVPDDISAEEMDVLVEAQIKASKSYNLAVAALDDYKKRFDNEDREILASPSVGERYTAKNKAEREKRKAARAKAPPPAAAPAVSQPAAAQGDGEKRTGLAAAVERAGLTIAEVFDDGDVVETDDGIEFNLTNMENYAVHGDGLQKVEYTDALFDAFVDYSIKQHAAYLADEEVEKARKAKKHTGGKAAKAEFAELRDKANKLGAIATTAAEKFAYLRGDVGGYDTGLTLDDDGNVISAAGDAPFLGDIGNIDDLQVIDDGDTAADDTADDGGDETAAADDDTPADDAAADGVVGGKVDGRVPTDIYIDPDNIRFWDEPSKGDYWKGVSFNVSDVQEGILNNPLHGDGQLKFEGNLAASDDIVLVLTPPAGDGESVYGAPQRIPYGSQGGVNGITLRDRDKMQLFVAERLNMGLDSDGKPAAAAAAAADKPKPKRKKATDYLYRFSFDLHRQKNDYNWISLHLDNSQGQTTKIHTWEFPQKKYSGTRMTRGAWNGWGNNDASRKIGLPELAGGNAPTFAGSIEELLAAVREKMGAAGYREGKATSGTEYDEVKGLTPAEDPSDVAAADSSSRAGEVNNVGNTIAEDGGSYSPTVVDAANEMTPISSELSLQVDTVRQMLLEKGDKNMRKKWAGIGSIGKNALAYWIDSGVSQNDIVDTLLTSADGSLIRLSDVIDGWVGNIARNAAKNAPSRADDKAVVENGKNAAEKDVDILETDEFKQADKVKRAELSAKVEALKAKVKKEFPEWHLEIDNKKSIKSPFAPVYFRGWSNPLDMNAMMAVNSKYGYLEAPAELEAIVKDVNALAKEYIVWKGKWADEQLGGYFTKNFDALKEMSKSHGKNGSNWEIKFPKRESQADGDTSPAADDDKAGGAGLSDGENKARESVPDDVADAERELRKLENQVARDIRGLTSGKGKSKSARGKGKKTPKDDEDNTPAARQSLADKIRALVTKSGKTVNSQTAIFLDAGGRLQALRNNPHSPHSVAAKLIAGVDNLKAPQLPQTPILTALNDKDIYVNEESEIGRELADAGFSDSDGSLLVAAGGRVSLSGALTNAEGRFSSLDLEDDGTVKEQAVVDALIDEAQEGDDHNPRWSAEERSTYAAYIAERDYLTEIADALSAPPHNFDIGRIREDSGEEQNFLEALREVMGVAGESEGKKDDGVSQEVDDAIAAVGGFDRVSDDTDTESEETAENVADDDTAEDETTLHPRAYYQKLKQAAPAAAAIVREIDNNRTFKNKEELFAAADVENNKTADYDGSDYKWLWEQVELAVNFIIIRDKITTVSDAASLAGQFPATMQSGKRDMDADEKQQYSTPMPIASAAALATGMGGMEVALEPSAGNGGLASFLPMAQTMVNEIDNGRLRSLRLLGNVFGAWRSVSDLNADGELKNRWHGKIDIVLMNPPFSHSKRVKNSSKVTDLHVINALSNVRDGGRAVIVTGENWKPSAPTHAGVFRQLRAQGWAYRATAWLDGALYSQYGASFPVRITVLDKFGSDAERDAAEAEDAKNEPARAKIDKQKDGAHWDQLAEFVRSVPARQPRETDEGNVPPAADSGGDTSPAQPEMSEEESSNILASLSTDRGAQLPSPSAKPRTPPAQVSGEERSRAEKTPRSNESPIVKPREVARGKNKEALPPIPLVAEAVRDNADADPQGASVGYVASVAGKQPMVAFETARNLLGIVPPALERGARTADGVDILNVGNEEGFELLALQIEEVHRAWDAFHRPAVKLSFLGDAEIDRVPGYYSAMGTGVGKTAIAAANIKVGRALGSGGGRSIVISNSHDLFGGGPKDFDAQGRRNIGLMKAARQQGLDPNSFILGKLKAASADEDKHRFGENETLFFTYSDFRAPDKESGSEFPANYAGTDLHNSRLRYLRDQLPKDWDGLIIFDEAHNMGNAVPKADGWGQGASKQAIAGVALQNMFPNAKILLLSGTPFKNAAGMTYATPMMLIGGEKSPFATHEELTEYVLDRGERLVGEEIALYLRALGLFNAVKLSWKDVRVESPIVTTTNEEKEQLVISRRAWAEIRREIFGDLQSVAEEATAPTMKDGEDVGGKAAALSGKMLGNIKAQLTNDIKRYFGFWQEFIKARWIVQDINRKLQESDGLDKFIIATPTTKEAAMSRAIAEQEEAQGLSHDSEKFDWSLVDITPLAMMEQSIMKNFDVRAMEVIEEEYAKDDGTKGTRKILQPVMRRDGNNRPILVFDEDGKTPPSWVREGGQGAGSRMRPPWPLYTMPRKGIGDSSTEAQEVVPLNTPLGENEELLPDKKGNAGGSFIITTDPARKARRDALIGRVRENLAGAISEIPIDIIRSGVAAEWGERSLGEMTGRQYRRDVDVEGWQDTIKYKRVVPKTNTERSLQRWQKDDVKVLVISEGVGGTGHDLPIPNDAKDDKGRLWGLIKKADGSPRRVHFYTLAFGEEANKTIQTGGRAHRSNEASAPIWIIPALDDIVSQLQAAAIAGKVGDMGAVSTGSQRGMAEGVFGERIDVDDRYTEQAVSNMALAMEAGRIDFLTGYSPQALFLDEMGFNTEYKQADENWRLFRVKLPRLLNYLQNSGPTNATHAELNQFHENIINWLLNERRQIVGNLTDAERSEVRLERKTELQIIGEKDLTVGGLRKGAISFVTVRERHDQGSPIPRRDKGGWHRRKSDNLLAWISDGNDIFSGFDGLQPAKVLQYSGYSTGRNRTEAFKAHTWKKLTAKADVKAAEEEWERKTTDDRYTNRTRYFIKGLTIQLHRDKNLQRLRGGYMMLSPQKGNARFAGVELSKGAMSQENFNKTLAEFLREYGGGTSTGAKKKRMTPEMMAEEVRNNQGVAIRFEGNGLIAEFRNRDGKKRLVVSGPRAANLNALKAKGWGLRKMQLGGDTEWISNNDEQTLIAISQLPGAKLIGDQEGSDAQFAMGDVKNKLAGHLSGIELAEKLRAEFENSAEYAVMVAEYEKTPLVAKSRGQTKAFYNWLKSDDFRLGINKPPPIDTSSPQFDEVVRITDAFMEKMRAARRDYIAAGLPAQHRYMAEWYSIRSDDARYAMFGDIGKEFRGDPFYPTPIHEIGDINKGGMMMPGDLPLRERAGMPLFGRLRGDVRRYRRELMAKEKAGAPLSSYSPMIDLYGGIGAELVERALELAPGRTRDALRGYGIGENGWRNARDWRRTLSAIAGYELTMEDLQGKGAHSLAVSDAARRALTRMLSQLASQISAGATDNGGLSFRIVDKVHPRAPTATIGSFDKGGTLPVVKIALNAATSGNAGNLAGTTAHEVGHFIYDYDGGAVLFDYTGGRKRWQVYLNAWANDPTINDWAETSTEEWVRQRELRLGPGSVSKEERQQIYEAELFSYALGQYAKSQYEREKAAQKAGQTTAQSGRQKRLPGRRLLARVWAALRRFGARLLATFGGFRPWMANSVFEFTMTGDAAREIHRRQKDQHAAADRASAESDRQMAFAGESAAGDSLLSLLPKAEQMIKAGIDRDSVWKRTGWLLGKDKKWRFELPDLRLRADWGDVLLDNPAATLGDIMETQSKYGGTEEILVRIPALGKVKVRVTVVANAGNNGLVHAEYNPVLDAVIMVFNAGNNFIGWRNAVPRDAGIHHSQDVRMGRRIWYDRLIAGLEEFGFAEAQPNSSLAFLLPSVDGDSGRNARVAQKDYFRLSEYRRKATLAAFGAAGKDVVNIRIALAHEIQHAVQKWTGLSPGSSQKVLESDARDALVKPAAIYAMMQADIAGAPNQIRRRNLLAISSEFDSAVDDTGRALALTKYLIESRYSRAIGEAEAREVENRLDKGSFWRKTNLPSWDGIAEDELRLPTGEKDSLGNPLYDDSDGGDARFAVAPGVTVVGGKAGYDNLFSYKAMAGGKQVGSMTITRDGRVDWAGITTDWRNLSDDNIKELKGQGFAEVGRRKGYGSAMYLAVAKDLYDNHSVVLKSNYLNENASLMWKSLVKAGYAIHDGGWKYTMLPEKIKQIGGAFDSEAQFAIAPPESAKNAKGEYDAKKDPAFRKLSRHLWRDYHYDSSPKTLFIGSSRGKVVLHEGLDPKMRGSYSNADSAREAIFATDNRVVAETYKDGLSPTKWENSNVFDQLEFLRQAIGDIKTREYRGKWDAQYWLNHVADGWTDEFGSEEEAIAAARAEMEEAIAEYEAKEKKVGDRVESERKKASEDWATLEVHLVMENPMVIDAKGAAAGTSEETDVYGLVMKAKENGHDGLIIENFFDPSIIVDDFDALKESGEYERYLGTHYAVFDESQVINARNGERLVKDK